MVRLETHVEAGAPATVNEDLVWTGEHAVVVLDGATGLTDRQQSDAESDGRWYVETLASELADRLEAELSLSAIASRAIEATSERYDELCHDSGDVAEHERPSAAGVICRWRDDEFEYFVLGDCSLVVQTTAGLETVLGEGPRALDQRVIDEMVAIRADETISQEELLERVEPMLISHRKLKNTPEGYWTFGLDPAATTHASVGTVPASELVAAIAFTDGFEPLCTVYDAVADWGALLEYVGANGLERATRVLRAFEASDPDCRHYPRLKPSDDVGVVYVEREP